MNRNHRILADYSISRDVYVNQAGFNFSAARFRLRGYSSENTRMFFNGIPVNDPENDGLYGVFGEG